MLVLMLLSTRPNCCPCEIGRWVFLVVQAEQFMMNFSESKGFFAEAKMRWSKWMDMHQEPPLSLARIGCQSFHVNEWATGGRAVEQAVGAEYTRAFLHVFWPQMSVDPQRSQRERGYREQLTKCLKEKAGTRTKYELTLGLFSLVSRDECLRSGLELYAESAYGEAAVDENAD